MSLIGLLFGMFAALFIMDYKCRNTSFRFYPHDALMFGALVAVLTVLSALQWGA